MFAFFCAIIAPISAASETVPPQSDWQTIVRNAPYWISQGVFGNVLTIRRWVLSETGYCEKPNRHILFDLRGAFLTYMDDRATRPATQQRLNQVRAQLAARQEVDQWSAGSFSELGYPFALSCSQPHAHLEKALNRYLGFDRGSRLWGAWDDLNFASESSPGSLHDALHYVYKTRKEQGRLTLTESMLPYLSGQILIESGGRKQAHSTANARGVMQLSPTALKDCQIKPENYWHRLAQLDCALRLTQQNLRNLTPDFESRFGHLPEPKKSRLLHLLLIQAYHGGANRVQSLLGEGQLGAPGRYFAEHHADFSAGDILFGMVFHNLGRDRFGLASLYYVADVQLAAEALEQSP